MQNAPNASKHSFLPYLFSCERKDRAAGGASETTTTERILAGKASFPLCSFLPFQTASQTCGLGFIANLLQPLSQPAADSSPGRGAKGMRTAGGSHNLSVSCADSIPTPLCPFGTFPPDRGNRPLKGEPWACASHGPFFLDFPAHFR